MKIAKEGFLFIAPSLVLAGLFLFVHWRTPAVLFLILSAAIVFFFRDPKRTPPAGEHLVLSPADGKVLKIDTVPAPAGLSAPATRICILLSLTDVHLTRAPIAARVGKVEYHPGRFFPAYRDEASEANESNTLLL